MDFVIGASNKWKCPKCNSVLKRMFSKGKKVVMCVCGFKKSFTLNRNLVVKPEDIVHN